MPPPWGGITGPPPAGGVAASASPVSGAPRSARNGTGSTGRPATRTSRCRWFPVESPVDHSPPSGSPIRRLSPTSKGLGAGAGEVGVPGADAGAAVEDHRVAIAAVPPGQGHGPGRDGDHGRAGGSHGQVDPCVQAPLVVDRVEPHPEPRRHRIRGLERRPPLPRRDQRSLAGGGAVQLVHRRRGDGRGDDGQRQRVPSSKTATATTAATPFIPPRRLLSRRRRCPELVSARGLVVPPAQAFTRHERRTMAALGAIPFARASWWHLLGKAARVAM